MIGLADELDWVVRGGSEIIIALFTVFPKAYINARERSKKELAYSMRRQDLEHLAEKGVSERIVCDQVFVANRVNDVLSGLRSRIEDLYSSLGKGVSGNSRHSLVLMCNYGEGSPLNDFKLGRYLGNDVLKGDPIDLMGDDNEVRRTLRGIRTKEGVGSLVINGSYSLYHSGVQLPPVSGLENREYNDAVEVGSRTEAMLKFSKNHPTYGSNPVWFYKLNGNKSIIQNGIEYKLYADN